jgi:glyceraldehyde-3-phosphate dehydrogenase/erythrose-4-phosphate dehydrogenase
MEVKAAIVGLGRVGSIFLKKVIEKKNPSIKIVAAAEKDENAPGVKLARDNGIKVFTEGREITSLGEEIDIIFDLTGSPNEKMLLRRELLRSKNLHTVLAPETTAHFIWGLIADGEELPRVHPEKGY